MRSPSKSFSPNRQAEQLIDVFEREVDTEYRGERYRVRDNGSAHRLPQKRQKSRPLDDQWIFGRQGLSTGSMYLSGVPVHRIVCVAFQCEPPSDRHVVIISTPTGQTIDRKTCAGSPAWRSFCSTKSLRGALNWSTDRLKLFSPTPGGSKAKKPSRIYPGCEPCRRTMPQPQRRV